MSGGGDSLALLHALAPLARERPVCALIVDHGLRRESAEEARRAADLARDAGAEPLILGWSGDKPVTGIQAHARQARHRLLAKAAKEAGSRNLFLAHTLDDQAETVWMRLHAGGGPAALAGMGETAPSPVWPEGRGVSLRRPLLGVRRAVLRAWLAALGAGWIEDKSNQDLRFDRVRARHRLAGLERGGFDPLRLARLADNIAVADRLRRHAAARLVRRAATICGWGGARLDARAFLDAPDSIALAALDALVIALSGSPHPPRRAAVDGLLQGLRQGEGATGGGIRLFSARGAMWLCRDAGALAGRVDLLGRISRVQEGDTLFLDGRFAIRGWPAGGIHGVLLGDRPPGWDLSDIPGEARQSLMTIHDITGALLAVIGVDGPVPDGLRVRPLFAERVAMRLFPEGAPAWFYRGLETGQGAK